MTRGEYLAECEEPLVAITIGVKVGRLDGGRFIGEEGEYPLVLPDSVHVLEFRE